MFGMMENSTVTLTESLQNGYEVMQTGAEQVSADHQPVTSPMSCVMCN